MVNLEVVIGEFGGCGSANKTVRIWRRGVEKTRRGILVRCFSFFYLLNNKYFCFKLFGLAVLEFGRAPTPC